MRIVMTRKLFSSPVPSVTQSHIGEPALSIPSLTAVNVESMLITDTFVAAVLEKRFSAKEIGVQSLTTSV
jgi:hypothetical protein